MSRLKANENFLQLQEELVSTESRIAFARQHYNDSVLGYNNKIETFPSNVIAGAFKLKQAEFFETEDEATGPVEVNFNGAASGGPSFPQPFLPGFLQIVFFAVLLR